MDITVIGIPAPQGSKRHVGRGIMIESSKKVGPWREAVKYAVLEQSMGIRYTGPVVVEIEYALPRPKSAKPGAIPAVKPDLDKLNRSTFDALTQSGIIEDDARIVCETSRKRYPEPGEATGAFIRVLPWRAA